MESARSVNCEIAIHGRGGQAAKTAGEILTHLLHRNGFNPHGQPRYTPDRMGAPVAYAIRFPSDRSRVFDRSWTCHPHLVVLFDLSLLEQQEIHNSWQPGITVIANATETAPGLAVLAPFRVARVDANGIARDLGLMKGSVPILSTVMAGAFTRASGLATLEELLATVRGMGKVAVGRDLEANLEAARRGYAEVILP